MNLRPAEQGFAITFGGNFTLVGGGPGVSAAGTWTSSSGQTGTWNGSKTNSLVWAARVAPAPWAVPRAGLRWCVSRY